MPQITVDYSDRLADTFDRPGFATAVHEAVVTIAAATPQACKTRFRRTEDTVVGPDTDGHAVVHVEIGLLAGRTEETRDRLAEAVLALLGQHLKPTGALAVHLSTEIRDLDPSYRSA
ncbi:5-carboxymethyl-2-hydroxymuconate Delta-isomerase [Streptomyces sp. NPDC086091]|uniref:5-carboxymethyl-2-hydroxymuconate Delta-isomerase n=1 Tax=Streptomyces sp. NPDC086091 TaxID=3365751 RepID=UPI00382FA4E8